MLNIGPPAVYMCTDHHHGAVARSDARPPGMRTVAGSILTTGKHSFADISWTMNKNLRQFSPFRPFKKGIYW